MFSFRSGAGGSALPGPLRSLRPNYEDRISLWCCVFLFFFPFKFQTCFYFSRSRGVFCCGLCALKHGHRSIPAENKLRARRLDTRVDGACHFQGRAALLLREPGRGDGLPAPVIYVRTCSQPSQRLMDVVPQDGAESVRCPLAQPLFPAGRRSHLFVTWSLRTWKALLGRWEWAAEGR